MKRLPLLAPLLPFLWLAPVYLTGKALFWGTPALQFFPWWHLATQTLLHGHWPLWNPLAGMGAPLFANYQSALLYPPVWLLLALDALGGLPLMAWAATLVVAAHLSWAAWGMTRLARALGLGALAQTVAGMAFGMSGYLTARAGLFPGMIFAAAWLPWVLLGVERLLRPAAAHSAWRQARPLAWAAGMQLLSGHAQTTWYTFVLAGLWLLRGLWAQRGYGPRRALRRAATAAGAVAVAALLATPQLLATAEYLLSSQRAAAYAYEAAMTYSFWPWRLLGLLAPGMFGSPVRGDYWGYAAFWEDALYLGVLPMALLGAWGITVLTRPLRRGSAPSATRATQPAAALSGIAALSLLLALLSLLLALGKNTPLFPWLYRHVPTFDMFQAPTRWNLWLEFALALLAALAAERWRRPAGRALYWTRLATAGAFAVTLGAGLGWLLLRGNADLQRLSTMARALAVTGFWGLGAGLLTLFQPAERAPGGKGRQTFALLAALWLGLDLLSAAWGLAPAAGLDFYRTPAQGAERRRARLTAGRRLYLPAEDEYRLKFRRFLRFDTFQPGGDWRAMRAVLLPNLFLPEGIASVNNFDPLLPGNYARWMALLEESPPHIRQWMLNRMSVGMVEQVDARWPSGVRFDSWAGLPRARWAACGELVPQEQVWERIPALARQGEAEPSGGRVLLTGAPPPAGETCFPPGEVSIQTGAQSPQRARFRVRVDSPGWFILADVWYPGWQARVDGASAPLWQADALFRAVFLPAGEHEVEFAYRPWWRWSVLFSLAAAALLLWKPSPDSEGEP